MHNPTDRIAHTTAFVAPVVDHWLEREISQFGYVCMYIYTYVCLCMYVCIDVCMYVCIVLWVVESIPHGGSTELFLIPAGAPRLVQQRPWYVLYCMWDYAYKRTLAANRKE